jgi:hypothetical protein
MEADQSFAWMLLISGDARVHATFMFGVTCDQLSSSSKTDTWVDRCTKRRDVRQQREVLAYAIRTA